MGTQECAYALVRLTGNWHQGPHPLTIRFTMIILGPSVLLMVNICISRRQNMMKSRERTMRPGYSSAGISLAPGRGRDLSSLLPGLSPAAPSPARVYAWPLEAKDSGDSWALKYYKRGVRSGNGVSVGVSGRLQEGPEAQPWQVARLCRHPGVGGRT